MSIIKKSINYAKEVGDIWVALGKIAKHFKDGKSLKDATVLLPAVMEAVNGADDVDDEYESDPVVVLSTSTYHAGQIAGEMFLVKKPDTQASS